MKLALWLLVAVLTLVAPSTVTSTADIATPVCVHDETEAIVALMASLLVDPNCLGVADDKCPSDARCLERLARVANKMPDCLSSASNTHKSQRARLQQLVDNCKVPVATTANTTANASKSAAGNELNNLNETSVRSTASAAATYTYSIAACSVAIAFSTACVAAFV